MTTRSLPVLDIAPPVADPAGPRDPFAPDDERLGEFRPEPRALPAFFVWTLGCQMNKSDSEEMAGRLLTAGCPEAPSMETADVVVINTCAIREAAEEKVIGRQGHLNRLKAANPSLRVVMTGCSVRESNRAGLARRYPAVDLFLRPDEEPELVDRLGLASAQAPVGTLAQTAATTTVKGAAVSDATHLVRARADAIAGGAVLRGSAISAWLPIIYGCDKTCTYCIVPFSRGPERSRPFDEIVDEARALAAAGYREVTLLGQNVNSYGHDLAPESRFAHVVTARTVGRQPGPRGAPGPRRADPRRRRTSDLGRATRHPAAAVRHLAPVGPERPADRRPAVTARRSAKRSTCLSSRARTRCSGGWAASTRSSTTSSASPASARPSPGSRSRRTSSSGSAARPTPSTRRPSGCSRPSATTRSSPLPTASGPGRRPRGSRTTCPPPRSAGGSCELLAVQEAIGHERNRGWLGRDAEVLVDTIVPPKHHDHEDEGADGASESRDAFADLPDGIVHLAGRSRENKLVHVAGAPSLVGTLVRVRIEHAGPYALRGALA